MNVNPPWEVPLAGGRANFGSVVRVGDEVARPRHPQTEFVEHFLSHLGANGYRFAPQPRPSDDQGRQRLTYIPGSAPTSPYPEWAFNESLLVDVAARQRELHSAACGYRPPDQARWAVSGGNYFPPSAAGELFCHNDLCMSNVIIDTDLGQVQGFIDFDYVAPVDRLFDIAVMARHWVPFGPLGSAEPLEVDPIRRFGVIAELHELDGRARARVVDFAIEFLDQARTNVGALAEAGNPGFQQLIANGYEATNRATIEWLVTRRHTLSSTP